MTNELITYKYENGIINNKALAERYLPTPPYPLKTIAGIHGFIVDWLIYEPSLRLDDIESPDNPEQAPKNWKYHRIENDYSLRPRSLVPGTPGDQSRAVANVTRKKGFFHAATYLWAESEQDLFLESDHYYAFNVWINSELVVDRMDARPQVSYRADENIHSVHLEAGPNLLALKVRLLRDHSFRDKHSFRLTGGTQPLTTVKVSLSAYHPEERREPEIVMGKLPNEVEEVRHFVSNYYPRTSSYNYFNKLYSEPRLCEFSGSSPSELERWRQRTRQKLTDMLGRPPESCDLDPQTVMKSGEGSYTKELLELQVEEDLWMPVFLFTPKKIHKGGAAVVYVGGHGGIDNTNIEYILECVRRGYIVLSVESRWYHRRSDPFEFDTSMLRGSFRVQKQDVHFAQHMCDLTARRAIAFGRNTMGMTVFDLIRAVDFLIQYTDTDKERIGTSGISLAGSITPFFAAVDTRIKATVASCFVVNYRFTQLHQYECGSLVIPGMLEYMDNHEICSLISPRYLLMERGVKNHRGIFENYVYRYVKNTYEIAKCPEKVKVDIFYGIHEYNGTKSLDWFDECL